MDSSKAISIS